MSITAPLAEARDPWTIDGSVREFDWGTEAPSRPLRRLAALLVPAALLAAGAAAFLLT